MGKKIRNTLLVLLFTVLILDSKTTIQGAYDAILLCIKTVIPSLFTFIVISNMLSDVLLNSVSFAPVRKICRIPKGLESLFLLGLLSGYPVGAKCIHTCYQKGMLDHTTAKRLLGFCSNCGPAFIFGICGPLFSNPMAPWLLWLTQILSAAFVGNTLPSVPHAGSAACAKEKTIPEILQTSIQAMLEVCAWVVLFRVFLSICDRWLLFLLPEIWKTIFYGIVELTNGCVHLSEIHSEAARFIVCSGLLSFGGLCVLMQTISVTAECGLGMYPLGKCLQTGMSLLISTILANILYHPWRNGYGFCVLLLLCVIIVLLAHFFINKQKKAVAIT